MNRPSDFALVAAKEITIAALQNTDIGIFENGDLVASFFETVYNKVEEIALKENG